MGKHNESVIFKRIETYTDEEIRELMELLPKDYAQTFQAYYFDGKTLGQIANETGLTRQAIAHRLNKVVQDLLIFSKYDDVIQGLANNPEFISRKRLPLFKYRKQFKELCQTLDYKTEILPFLDERDVSYINNFMFKYRPANVRKIETRVKYLESPFEMLAKIIAKIERISEKLKETRAFFDKNDGNQVSNDTEGSNDFFVKFGEEDKISKFESCLSEEEKCLYNSLFKNNPNGKDKKVAGKKVTVKLNKRIIQNIDEKASHFMEVEKRSQDFYERIGGENMLADIELFLDDDEKAFLNEDFLNYNLMGKDNIYKKFDYNSSSYLQLKRDTFRKIDNVLKYKEKCEKFIQENGGEDFLLNEFGATLSEEDYFVLVSCLMDYHYTTISDVSKKVGFNVASKSYRILEKLDEYKLNKQKVDSKVAELGEDKIMELAGELDDLGRKVLFEYYLAYCPLSIVDIVSETGTTEYEVKKRISTIESLFWKLEKQKSNGE